MTDDLVASIMDTLECSEAITMEFIEVALRDIALFDRKQHDRGPGNVAAYGEKGVLVRTADKLSRLTRIVWDGVEPKVSEPVEQEWADMSVYGIIARMCRAGVWPGVRGDAPVVLPDAFTCDEATCQCHAPRPPEPFVSDDVSNWYARQEEAYLHPPGSGPVETPWQVGQRVEVVAAGCPEDVGKVGTCIKVNHAGFYLVDFGLSTVGKLDNLWYFDNLDGETDGITIRPLKVWQEGAGRWA